MKALTLAGLMMVVLLSACDPNRNKATLGGTRDTTKVIGNGVPPAKDTATINQERSDSAKRPVNSAAKGNADPSGHIKNQ